MSQVLVKWVPEVCILDSKRGQAKVPVVELAALREVVEGLKRINELAAHNHTDTFDPVKWLVQIREESKRLLASLGEVGKQ